MEAPIHVVASCDNALLKCMCCLVFKEGYTSCYRFWAFVLCLLIEFYSGSRMQRHRLFRWQFCGAVGSAAAMVVYARLWEPACEPQNIAAYDKPKG
jgi:hypothetical protein